MANPAAFNFHYSPPPERTQHEIDARDPAIEATFGVGTAVVEGIPIEAGSGALPVAKQLTHAVLRVFNNDGREAAHTLLTRLLDGGHFNSPEAADLLVGNNLISPAAAHMTRKRKRQS
jgi:hypothetical protein